MVTEVSAEEGTPNPGLGVLRAEAGKMTVS